MITGRSMDSVATPAFAPTRNPTVVYLARERYAQPPRQPGGNDKELMPVYTAKPSKLQLSGSGKVISCGVTG